MKFCNQSDRATPQVYPQAIAQARIQEMEGEKAPVREILQVLEVFKL